jgi:hypothetical protein
MVQASEAPQRVSEFSTAHLTIWLEPPDLVRICSRGEVGEDDVVKTMGYFRELVKTMPYVLMLVDMSQQKHITSQARKAAAGSVAGIPYRGTALYGAPFATRIAAQMTMTVVNAVVRNENPTQFFEGEAEARAWIEARRRKVTGS